MKFALIALSIMGSASSAFAAAECAQGTKTLYACTAAPQAGNSEAISGTFDSLAICDEGQKTSLVAEKSGESDSMPAAVVSRAGGVSYVVVIPEEPSSPGEVTHDTVISLSVPAGLSPRVKTVTGTLKVDFGGVVNGSTTYSCEVR